MKVYCLKCRKATEMKDPIQTELWRSKRPAIKGVCSECGSAVFRVGKLKDVLAESGDAE